MAPTQLPAQRFTLYAHEHQQWLKALTFYSDQEAYLETLLSQISHMNGDYEMVSRSGSFRQWLSGLRAQMAQLCELIEQEKLAERLGQSNWQRHQEIDERHRRMRSSYQMLEQQFITVRQQFYAFITPHMQ